MPYTRRVLLKDVAISSVAAATSPISFLGCRQKPSHFERLQPHTIMPPSMPGMNIFFEGCWLFTGDGKGGMYAIARDMVGDPQGTPVINHTFPFGQYRGAGFDKNNPCLAENPQDASNNHIPYTVTLSGFDATKAPNDVFDDALNYRKGPFYYLMNADPKKKLLVDLTRPGMRLIALPKPTAIVPCGFHGDAKMNDLTGGLFAKPGSMANYTDHGVATTHIFQYAPASSSPVIASFTQNGSVPLTVTGPDHLHFHSVPPHLTAPHGPDMLENLLHVIYYVDSSGKPVPLSLQDISYSGGTACPFSGMDAESLNLSKDELDLPEACERGSNIASCAAGAFGMN